MLGAACGSPTDSIADTEPDAALADVVAPPAPIFRNDGSHVRDLYGRALVGSV